MIDGRCARGFEPVRDAFAANFAERGDTGAALCVTVGGLTAVDLWGGWADMARSRPWQPDTLVNVFSVGKGLLAMLAARLAGEGRLSADAAVRSYWPEFGAAGKESVTVRQLLSHQAGLPAVRRRLPRGAMLDWELMTAELAAHPPWWEPGSAHGYHVNTFGFLIGEVIRRRCGRSVGTVLREEVAGPLGADVHRASRPAVLTGCSAGRPGSGSAFSSLSQSVRSGRIRRRSGISALAGRSASVIPKLNWRSVTLLARWDRAGRIRAMAR